MKAYCIVLQLTPEILKFHYIVFVTLKILYYIKTIKSIFLYSYYIRHPND